MIISEICFFNRGQCPPKIYILGDILSPNIFSLISRLGVVLNHIVNCDQVNFIKSIFSIPTANAIHPKIDKKKFNINLVQENLRILDKSRFWNELLIKEALKIKERKPILNNGLNASKELKLF